MQEAQGLVFGPFRLDLRDERLWRGQEVIHVHPKTLAVLRALVAQAGQLVTKDALFAAVWPETAVSESVLTVAIRQLRRVLEDQARRPRFIETVHGRGYRFIAPVAGVAPVPERLQTTGTVRLPQPVVHDRATIFVGREGELAQMRQWWAQARLGTRQVGIIAGEPGIGKTTLVTTFVGQVTTGEALWVGHGQCSEQYGPGEPYLPVLEALGRLCRGPEGARLVAVLRQYAPSWVVQMPALLPPDEWEALQRTVGPAVQPRMLRELTDALDAFTIECPLVLVMEDLHWSDRATLAWLAYVARRPDPARLLLLGTYRPVEAIVHGHPLRAVLTELRQHGQCVELALDYLSEAEVAAYLSQRFGSTRLGAELACVLHQRTKGNPLFLIAVVNELVRQQVVTEEADGWAVRAEVETISEIVPAHLRALIELQLTHCSPEDQTLLAVASVAGVEFATAAVAAGLEGADEEIEARCAALAHQGQFLQANGQVEWPDGTVTAGYGFRHALYQEVLYQRLPAGRQTHWHARIGTRLAQGFGEEAGEMAAAVAMHCVRGRLLPQAVPYLRQAGEKAMARSAHHEAVGYFEQALGVLGHLPESRATREQAIDLCFDLRNALWPLGDHQRLFDYLCQAETRAKAIDDKHRLGRVCSFMIQHFRLMGEANRAIEYGERALTLAATLSEAYLVAGRLEDARQLARRALELSHTHKQCAHQAWVLRLLGESAAHGEPPDAEGAERHYRKALALADELGMRPLLAHCHRGLGMLYLKTGRRQPARAELSTAIALYRAMEMTFWLPQVEAALVEVNCNDSGREAADQQE